MRSAVFIAAIALLASAPAHARIDESSFGGLAFRQHPGARLPLDARLLDQYGRQVSLGSQLDGRPTALVLEYLRCQNLCSLVLGGATQAMAQAHLMPGRDLNLVAVSIDPRDTTADASAASARYSRDFPDPSAARKGIRFLTASSDQVERIADAVGFPYEPDRQSGQYAHPAGFVILTPNGQISRYMLGLDPPAAALREAVAQADRGAITPPAHPLLLLCFGYDPDAGTASALALRLVRYVYLAALLACALAAGAFWLKRRAA